jgi:hypothetical protein
LFLIVFGGDLFNRIKKLIILPFLVLLGLWVILGWMHRPSFSHLPSLIPGSELFFEEETISICVKPLSPEESEKYLKTDAVKLGYTPVQITIENQSLDPYLVTSTSISLPLADAKDVASAAKRSSLPASIGLRVAGFIFWPFSIPSTMHGIKTMEAYEKNKKELSIKSIKEEIIPPYTTMNRVFFVKEKEYKSSFSVKLVNQETLESKIFSIEDVNQEQPLALKPLLLPEENYYLTYEQ